MNIAERHQEILSILQKDGYVDVNDLSDRFGISAVTIRKDLKLLEEKGLLFRSHGRAIKGNPYISEHHVVEKAKLNASEKERIAAYAGSLVKSDDHIILASGTSVHEFARQIKHIDGLTVLSASLSASMTLTENPKIDLLQLGGMVRPSSSSVVGPLSERMLSEFTFTKLILGVDGVDLDYGLSTTNAYEASLNKLMIKAAQQTIVLADSSKFGRKGFGKICDLDAVHTIITDKGIDKLMKTKILDRGLDLVIV